jgi:hypothetical protein
MKIERIVQPCVFWAVANAYGYVFGHTVRDFRRDDIAAFTDPQPAASPALWKKFRKAGFGVYKIEIRSWTPKVRQAIWN